MTVRYLADIPSFNMRVSALVALLFSFGSSVYAQADYDELPKDFLFTTNPSTVNLGVPGAQGQPMHTVKDPPNTGVIRSYDFTVRRQKKAPDGYMKDVLTINGQFPGPLIEANWGDTIQVTLHNEIHSPEEGTALHWHGILQKKSQWMDGVPGVQQCPVAPGKSFTYSFIADLYGTSWYHSHYSAQYAGGLVGPMIIHGPNHVEYDIDKGPIMLGDHYHREYLNITKDVVGKDVTLVGPSSDNNLINGRNPFDCSKKGATDTAKCDTGDGRISNFRLSPNKKHRLRLINCGAEAMQKFSIDNHTLTVIANDFVPVVPYDTKVVTLGIGQRTDVIVTGLKDPAGAYAMRSSVAGGGCSFSFGPDALAIAYYKHEEVAKGIPNTKPWQEFTDSVNGQCANDDLAKTVPYYPIAPPPQPAVTQQIDIEFGPNATGNWVWTMNKVSFRANYNQPILMLSNLGNNSYPYSPQWNVYNFGSNSSVRIVINNPFFLSHPIHLHGHNMFVEAVGPGTWDGNVVNPSNPQRRDVQIVPAAGHLVLSFKTDNPGAWPLHCHIAWHVSAGLYVTVLERPDDIAKLTLPSIMAQTCRDWAAFSNKTVIDQIDSGL